MGQSWYVIFSVLLLNFRGFCSAPVRATVEGFVGDSADLSCTIPEREIQGKVEEFSVHWRDDEEKRVCEFTGGSRTCQGQDAKYKDRIETFPEEYKKGKFSIKLNGLQISDARKYICHITGPSQNHTITELIVEKARRNHGEPSSPVLLISFLFNVILLLIRTIFV